MRINRKGQAYDSFGVINVTFASERKKMLVSTGVNFALGSVMGTILFYGFLRGGGGVRNIEFSRDITPLAVARLTWLNLLWLFSIFIMHQMFFTRFFQPIMIVRAVTCTFSASYIMTYSSVRAAVAAVLPQCLSILPIMAFFTSSVIKRQERKCLGEKSGCTIQSKDVFRIFLIGALGALLETLFFAIICRLLL